MPNIQRKLFSFFSNFKSNFPPHSQAVNTNTRNRSLGRLRRQPPRHGIGKCAKPLKNSLYLLLLTYKLVTILR